MALKKDIFNKYIKTRSSDELDDALRKKRKFTHNRVFHLSSEDKNKENSVSRRKL